MKLAPVLAALISGCTLPAPAVEWTAADTIKLTAAEAERCRAEGGCVVITVHMLRHVLETAQACLKRNSI